MAKDRYTEERDKQEKAKRLRGKQANHIIGDEDIIVEPDPVEETTEADSSDDLSLSYINISPSG